MLTWLAVDGVRNLAPQRIELPTPLVLFEGGNAQGKSSLLEALYLLATTRSYRCREPREAIVHDGPQLRVEGGGGDLPELGIGLGRKRGERALSVGKSEAKLAEYLALLPTLVLAGESIRALAGSPSERRRYIDRATAAADPAHLVDLGEYRRALAHRNELLRTSAPDAHLDPWDELVAASGARVVARRRSQIAAWQADLGAWPQLFPEGAAARLAYREAGQPRGEELTLRERLLRLRGRDRQEGATSAGPHRDDFTIVVEGRDLLGCGSAGQMRAALAATTVAQARQVARSHGGRRPQLLIDDVDTDLDRARIAALLAAATAEARVVAASSKPELLGSVEGSRLRVAAGRIEAYG